QLALRQRLTKHRRADRAVRVADDHEAAAGDHSGSPGRRPLADEAPDPALPEVAVPRAEDVVAARLVLEAVVEVADQAADQRLTPFVATRQVAEHETDPGAPGPAGPEHPDDLILRYRWIVIAHGHAVALGFYRIPTHRRPSLHRPRHARERFRSSPMACTRSKSGPYGDSVAALRL